MRSGLARTLEMFLLNKVLSYLLRPIISDISTMVVSRIVSYFNSELYSFDLFLYSLQFFTDWFTYDSVYFGASPGQVGQLRLRFSKGNYHGRLEIRLGDQDGPVIGDFLPYFTGGWGTYKEATFAIDAGSIEGYHQVTFRGWDTSGVMGVDWWELAAPVNPSDHTLYERKQAEDVLVAYRVNVASWGLSYFDRGDFVGYENIWFGEEGDVSKITVRYAKGSSGGRIEARLDGRYGAVLGSFYPSVTGSYGTYVEATFDLSSAVSVSGLHMLYLIGYDLRRGIWNVDWLQLAA